jgi:restriction endonuclease S subunit
VIPDDWDMAHLCEKIDVFRGGSPRPIQNYLTKSANGINWIKIGDVGIAAKYIDKTDEKIIPEGAFYSRSVSIGDFLLSNSMSFGRPYILRISGCIHDGWLVLQNYKTNFHPEYLYYILGSDIVLQQYISMASGSSVLNLNKELVSLVILPIPSLPEQTAIAEILSDVDVLIESLEKLIAKKKAIKQGAMQELPTGKRRLPGFDGEWKVVVLGDVCEIISGGTPSTSIKEYWNGSIWWCTPTDITACQSKYISRTDKTITEKGLDNSSAVLLPINTLLLCSRATIGEVRICTVSMSTNQGFKSLIANQDISNEWLYYIRLCSITLHLL